MNYVSITPYANGVLLKRFPPRFPLDSIYILYYNTYTHTKFHILITTTSSRKGFQVLFSTGKLLSRRYPGHDFHSIGKISSTAYLVAIQTGLRVKFKASIIRIMAVD